MKTYTIHGFTLSSEIPLPELDEVEGEAQVTLRLGKVEGLEEEIVKSGHWYKAGPKAAWLVWEKAGRFLIQDGREVVVEPADGVNPDFLRLFLLGSVMGLLLQQRGLFPLHASTVMLDGKALAIAGGSGSGKSSLAVALFERGAKLVSDDITAVDFRGALTIVLPGNPLFRLWPETLEAFGLPADDFERHWSETEKRIRPAKCGITEPAPLSAIYMIRDTNDKDRIETLSPSQGLIELLKNSYTVELLHEAVGQDVHMKHCAKLAESVKIYEIKRNRSLAQLNALAELVEIHFEQA